MFNGSPHQLQGELAVPPSRLSCALQLSSTLRWTPRLLNQMKASALLEQELLPPSCAAIVRAGQASGQLSEAVTAEFELTAPLCCICRKTFGTSGIGLEVAASRAAVVKWRQGLICSGDKE